jgi:hypothetical protein
MKTILSLVLMMSIAAIGYSQSIKVGRLDNDGNAILTMEQNACSAMIKQLSSRNNAEMVNVTDISFTQLPRGQFCITGYEKDNNGRILKGFRIACSQDDENNLIVNQNNFSARVAGKAF